MIPTTRVTHDSLSVAVAFEVNEQTTSQEDEGEVWCPGLVCGSAAPPDPPAAVRGPEVRPIAAGP